MSFWQAPVKSCTLVASTIVPFLELPILSLKLAFVATFQTPQKNFVVSSAWLPKTLYHAYNFMQSLQRSGLLQCHNIEHRKKQGYLFCDSERRGQWREIQWRCALFCKKQRLCFEWMIALAVRSLDCFTMFCRHTYRRDFPLLYLAHKLTTPILLLSIVFPPFGSLSQAKPLVFSSNSAFLLK